MIDGLQAQGRAEPRADSRRPRLLLVEFGADDAADGRRDGAAPHRAACSGSRPRRTSGCTRRTKPRPSGRSASPGRAPPISAPGLPPRWEGWDDSAVAPEKLGAYLRDLRRLLDEYDYQAAYYGHFGHGCIHMQVSFDLRTEAGHPEVRRVRRSRRRPGGQLRRLALGRARRRPVARRAAAEDVRSRADGGVPRVQGDLGSRQQAESRTS